MKPQTFPMEVYIFAISRLESLSYQDHNSFLPAAASRPFNRTAHPDRTPSPKPSKLSLKFPFLNVINYQNHYLNFYRWETLPLSGKEWQESPIVKGGFFQNHPFEIENGVFSTGDWLGLTSFGFLYYAFHQLDPL